MKCSCTLSAYIEKCGICGKDMEWVEFQWMCVNPNCRANK